jgi:hypothetical protein
MLRVLLPFTVFHFLFQTLRSVMQCAGTCEPTVEPSVRTHERASHPTHANRFDTRCTQQSAITCQTLYHTIVALIQEQRPIRTMAANRRREIQNSLNSVSANIAWPDSKVPTNHQSDEVGLTSRGPGRSAVGAPRRARAGALDDLWGSLAARTVMSLSP